MHKTFSDVSSTVRRALTGVALILATAPAWAAVQASGAWIRWLPAGLPAAGYVELHNDADHAVKLVGVSSPDYGMLMLHRSQLENDKMVMRHVDSVTVPAHGAQALQPAGFHIMLMSPKHDVHPGQRVPLTLKFDDGEQLKVEFAVRKSDGETAPAAAQHGMDMPGMSMPGMHGNTEK